MWVVSVQCSGYIASLSLTVTRLLAFFYERGMSLVLSNSGWYHTSFVSLGGFIFLQIQMEIWTLIGGLTPTLYCLSSCVSLTMVMVTTSYVVLV